MKITLSRLFTGLYLFSAFAFANTEPPSWAYALNPPNNFPVPADDSIRQVPRSDLSYTFVQVKDLFLTPDWHPQDHTHMPTIVAYGRKPDVYACGFCHRADGPGGPENASLAGLPKAYIIQQMQDFKSGARKSAVPTRATISNMILVAKAAKDQEVETAAEYFSALNPRRNIKLIETEKVPKTYERGWHLAKLPSNETEAMGQRIIEVPDNLDDFISRDSRTTFTAYAPKGSVKRGRKLTQTGAQSCVSCHGKKLQGMGDTPRLAGRSPTYLFRQLYDFQSGVRKGKNSAVMQEAVANLSAGDMIALAAYSASLEP